MLALKGEGGTPYFNPRSPCGERLHPALRVAGVLVFQSTLPVWGATPIWGAHDMGALEFQSTLPVWGATLAVHIQGGPIHQISIHAPRVGSDSKTAQILLEILSHLNSFAPSEKKKIPFHRKEQGKFIEIF